MERVTNDRCGVGARQGSQSGSINMAIAAMFYANVLCECCAALEKLDCSEFFLFKFVFGAFFVKTVFQKSHRRLVLVNR